MFINKRIRKNNAVLYKSVLLTAVILFLLVFDTFAGSADNAQKYFRKGEGQFSGLYKEGVRESRQNWTSCAENFKKAYDAEPSGDYAPVSLYFYGKVYRDLYRFSANQDDLETARVAFRKVASTFPQSTYSHKAEAELEGMPSSKLSGQIKSKKPEVMLETLGVKKIKDDAQKKEIPKKEDSEPKVIPEKKSAVSGSKKELPSLKNADSKPESQKKSDIKASLPETQPVSPQGSKSGAVVENKKASGSEKDKKNASTKDDEKVKPVEKKSVKTPSITGIRHWTENGYTRIVIDADSKVSYKYGVEKKKSDDLEYLVFNIKNCAVSNNAKREFSFKSKIVKKAEIREDSDSVKVLIGVTTSENFNVFPLSGPNDSLKYRVVVDVKGTSDNKSQATVSESKSKTEAKSEVKSDSKSSSTSEGVEKESVEKEGTDSVKSSKKDDPRPEADKTESSVSETGSGVPVASIDYDREIQKSTSRKPQPGALAKQLALGVRKIVIDPGHGGNDPGAMAPKGVREKDISLSIAKRLAYSLKKKTGCEVALTRSTDTYLHLEERTAIANTQRADLFISLHLNSSPAKEAQGIETYFLNLATDESAIAVAARENATSTKNISDLEDILKDLMRNAKIDESKRLAKNVQKNMCSSLSRKYSPVKDKGVKQAPFYVLMGARMPAILIETGFISNPGELSRLMSSDYQAALSDSIADGVAHYMNSFSSNTYIKKDSPGRSATSKKSEAKKPAAKKLQPVKKEPVKAVPKKTSQSTKEKRG